MKPILTGAAIKLRLNAIRPYLSGRVLDIGCGFSALPDVLVPDQAYVGVDIKPRALEYNARRYPQHKFYSRDLENEPLVLPEDPFETVIMGAVLEHLRRPEKVLYEIRALLSTNGALVVTTPSPTGDLAHKFGSQLRLFYPEGTVQHIKIFNHQELVDLLKVNAYKIEKFRYFMMGLNQLVVARSEFEFNSKQIKKPGELSPRRSPSTLFPHSPLHRPKICILPTLERVRPIPGWLPLY